MSVDENVLNRFLVTAAESGIIVGIDYISLSSIYSLEYSSI